jgi:hypothetical protein
MAVPLKVSSTEGWKQEPSDVGLPVQPKRGVTVGALVYDACMMQNVESEVHASVSG